MVIWLEHVDPAPESPKTIAVCGWGFSSVSWVAVNELPGGR